MSMDTVGTEYSKLKRYRAEGRGQRAENALCPLPSALSCVSERYGFVGAAGAGFCVAGGAAVAGGGVAGLAVDGAGAAGLSRGGRLRGWRGAPASRLVAYLPESNRLITSRGDVERRIDVRSRRRRRR